jgi:hypothetical protein
MRLTDSEVADFARIIREDYGVPLSPSEARTEAEGILRFAAIILHPPKEK